MKKSQEKLKAEFLAEAEALFDELMAWDDETQEPDLTQIEDIVLKLRERFGKQLAEKVMEQQEKRQPAERVHCPRCGGELVNKGWTVLLPAFCSLRRFTDICTGDPVESRC